MVAMVVKAVCKYCGRFFIQFEFSLQVTLPFKSCMCVVFHFITW